MQPGLPTAPVPGLQNSLSHGVRVSGGAKTPVRCLRLPLAIIVQLSRVAHSLRLSNLAGPRSCRVSGAPPDRTCQVSALGRPLRRGKPRGLGGSERVRAVCQDWPASAASPVARRARRFSSQARVWSVARHLLVSGGVSAEIAPYSRFWHQRGRCAKRPPTS